MAERRYVATRNFATTNGTFTRGDRVILDPVAWEPEITAGFFRPDPDAPPKPRRQRKAKGDTAG